MKYVAEFYLNNKEHNVEFNFYGYKNKNLFFKAAKEVVNHIYNNELENDVYTCTIDLPNVWRNGAVGYIALQRMSNKTYIQINLRQKRSKCYIAN